MAVQSGLFKLLLPLPNVPQSSLARRLAPPLLKNEDGQSGDRDGEGENDSAVLFLLHPKQPLSIIAVSVFPTQKLFTLVHPSPLHRRSSKNMQ